MHDAIEKYRRLDIVQRITHESKPSNIPIPGNDINVSLVSQYGYLGFLSCTDIPDTDSLVNGAGDEYVLFGG
jgi:hypothetical protein